MRTPMLLGWVSWAYNVPEGFAVPLARATGGGPVAASAIMAVMAGAILIAVVLRPGLPGILFGLAACTAPSGAKWRRHVAR